VIWTDSCITLPVLQLVLTHAAFDRSIRSFLCFLPPPPTHTQPPPRYCENGCLIDVVRKADAPDTHMLLTYCHDVASALHYLGSRRIVHRDVAARNVLLDAAYTCKLSDFGMSTAVCGEDTDYSTNYVKVTPDQPPSLLVCLPPSTNT
jgi:hypothetical protein